MPLPGWGSISLKDDLIRLIDRFLKENDEGYSSRAEVVASAVRKFVADFHARKALERATHGARASVRRRGGAR